MRKEKELLERRLVLPLAEADLADEYGVVPPRAVVLFGPPGTGKTTFAKAIASRLEWPFVEVFPSRLASDPRAWPARCARRSWRLPSWSTPSCSSTRWRRSPRSVRGEPPSPLQGVTNELLKIIPAFREQPGRLLVCATNFIRALDTAFLRHGRFDYVIPIGLPDRGQAREAMWQRYLAAVPHVDVDMAAIVGGSELFTPADIEFAARRTAQLAFERVLFDHGKEEVTTADVLRGIAETRRTLTSRSWWPTSSRTSRPTPGSDQACPGPPRARADPGRPGGVRAVPPARPR